MKNDLFKLIVIVWMTAILFLAYSMWIDLRYVTDLVYGYMQLVMEHVRK